MQADDVVSSGPLGNFLTVGVPIIPEVILVGKELVFVVELDLIQPAVTAPAPPVVTLQLLLYGSDIVTYGSDSVGY